MKDVYKEIIDYFFKEMEMHGNPFWAIDTLDYLIFNKHLDEFEKLTDDEKSEVRHIMSSLNLIYR